jgi:hypothetical protein
MSRPKSAAIVLGSTPCGRDLWIMAIALVASLLTGCSEPGSESKSVSRGVEETEAAVVCWDLSHPGGASACPPLAGEAALQWIIPTMATDNSRSCRAVHDLDPPDELVESVECTWPDMPAHLRIDRYSGPAAAELGGTPWVVGGTRYGKTSHTVGGQAETWYVYDGEPFQIQLIGADDAELQRIAARIQFRDPVAVHNGADIG